MFLLTAYGVAGEPHPVLVAFSAYTNGKKLFRVSKNSGEFSCLHGMRFFSLIWVVYGHTFYTILIGPLTNIFDVIRVSYQDTTIMYHSAYILFLTVCN